MQKDDVMLTTIDNPYNPFEDYEAWRMFDIEKQHFTCERLGRIAIFSDDMSDPEIDEEIERAMDEIIKYDPEDKFQKVYNHTTN